MSETRGMTEMKLAKQAKQKKIKSSKQVKPLLGANLKQANP